MFWKKIGGVCGKEVISVDEKIHQNNIPVGMALILVGGAILSLGLQLVSWLLCFFGLLIILFGLGLFFLPVGFKKHLC